MLSFLVVVFLGFLGLAFYMLPWLIAGQRKCTASTSICVVNVLAGWTVIGWIGCMIWACTAETEADVARNEQFRAMAEALRLQAKD